MNTPDEIIAVVTAFKEGKPIQNRNFDRIAKIPTTGWCDNPTPHFNFEECEYRVKPAEPRIRWINEYGDESDCVHKTKEAADRGQSCAVNRIRCSKWVEVIE
jgi:hypothetical protein